MNRVFVTFAVQMFAAWVGLLGVAFYWATQTACGGGAAVLADSGVDISGVQTGRQIDRGGRASNALANPRLQHPKVDMLKSEIQEFRNLKNVSTSYKNAYNGLLNYANQWLAHTTSYPFLQKAAWERELRYMRYAYLATGDAKYAEHAKALALYAAENWVPQPGISSIDNWTGIRGCREATAAFARTYDTLYDYLTAAERATLLDATRQWGTILLADMKKYFYNQDPEGVLYGPHIEKGISYLAQAAVAMDGEFPEASEWLDYCINHWTRPIGGYDWPTYAGGNDGGLSMGPYYGLDGTALKWEAFDAMKKLGYADLYSIPFVQNLGDFYLYMMPPNARFFGTFGDGGATVHINSCAMLERWDMLWLSQVYQNPGWRWWVANKKIEASDPPADPLDPSGVQWNYQILLLGLREAKTPVAASPPTVPNSKLFPESGFVSMHTDIANPAEDTILNMRCAPYPRGSVHHSQPDQNAFVLYHHGAPLAINAAYYGGLADVDFGDPYSVYWGRQTKSKNAILIDNVGQRPDRATSAGEILQFDSTADYDYFVGDAVQAYNLNQSGIANAVRRHAAMVHKPGEAPYVVMVDEVRMPAAHNIQWLLHTMSQAVVDAANQKIILTYGNVHAQVRLFAPQALTISQTNLTDPLLTVDTARLGEHWHLTCATPSAATTFLIGSVFFPYVDGEEGAIPSISGHANGDNSQFTFTVGADTVNVDVASMAMSIVSGQTP